MSDRAEPMSPPEDVARLVGQVNPPEREVPTCSACGSADLALATGICLACGYDTMGYWDDDFPKGWIA